MPITPDQARALKVGDTVTLEKTLYGIRDATLIHMFDRDRRTRLDLQGHAVIHTAPNVHKVPVSPEAPVGYTPFCIGTTTSQRMERFTRPLMLQRAACASSSAARRHGAGRHRPRSRSWSGAYLAIVGGAAALETTWIEQIEDIDLDDLHPESLWRFRIKGFGPLLVGMDSHGGSLFADNQKEVASRRDAVLKSIGAA